MKVPDDLASRVVTRRLPPMPEPVEFANGRIGWPAVFVYKNDSGTSALPFGDGSAWTVHIFDLPAYELLVATGALIDVRHSGREPSEIVDNRKAG